MEYIVVFIVNDLWVHIIIVLIILNQNNSSISSLMTRAGL